MKKLHKYDFKRLWCMIFEKYFMEYCDHQRMWTGPLISRTGIEQPLRKIRHQHNIVYQGKIAIIGVHKKIQVSIYPGKGGLTCLLSNEVKKVSVRGGISW